VTDPRALFQSDLYVRHNARRLEHLASLGLDLTGRSVLELGAGIGDHSVFYLDRGCTVTAIEPRPENVEVLRGRMRELPGVWNPERLRVVEARVEDLDRIDGLGQFDVVHCYGLLYHLGEPLETIRAAAAHCRGVMVVETKVRLAEHPATSAEDHENATNSFDGRVTLLERAELLAGLASCLPHVYVPVNPVAHEQFPADWARVPAGQWPLRMVAVASRQPLSSAGLRSA
jgi:predicted RNA methylase